MKKLLIVALVAGGAFSAMYPPFVLLTVAFALATVVALAWSDTSFSSALRAADFGHDSGHLPLSRLSALYSVIPFLMLWTSAVYRRVGDMTSFLATMFLVAMRALANLALMLWAGTISLLRALGGSGHSSALAASPS